MENSARVTLLSSPWQATKVVAKEVTAFLAIPYWLQQRTRGKATENVKKGGQLTRDLPKAHNELVSPQQPKEVVDEEVLQLFVPNHSVVAAGVVGAINV